MPGGRYAVYRNLAPRSRTDVPFLLDVQADLFGSLASRVVVPLIRAELVPTPLRGLQPGFTVDGVPVVMDTPALVGAPARALGMRVADLASEATTILAALDLLFTGA